MEIEFLDPGPNQPEGPGEPEPGPPRPERRRPRVDRETLGLLVMLTAAAVLPVVAAFQLVFTVRGNAIDGPFTYGVDAWGRFRLGDGSAVGAGQHEPRFGVLLGVCGAAFAVLALTIAAEALLRTAPGRRAGRAAVAGASGVLAGLLLGVTASMALEVESVFDRLRSSPPGLVDSAVPSFRLEVGAAIWLSLAGVLAGGLAVAAALRRQRGDGLPHRLPHSSITNSGRGY